MRNIIIFLVFLNFIFAKTNINEADRYELMIVGELDAGRADMLINHRKKNEITSPNELKTITGFSNYNTQKLVENFEFKSLEKKEKKDIEKIDNNPNVIIVEKTKIINRPYTYQRTQRYGDIEIIDTYSLPNYRQQNYRKNTPPPPPPRYERRPKPRPHINNNYQKEDGVSVDGNINIKIHKNL